MAIFILKRCILFAIIAFILVLPLSNNALVTAGLNSATFDNLLRIEPTIGPALSVPTRQTQTLINIADDKTSTPRFDKPAKSVNSVQPDPIRSTNQAPGKDNHKTAFSQTTIQLWKIWQQQLLESDYQQLPIFGIKIAEHLRHQPDELIYQEIYDLVTSSDLSVEQKAIVVDLLSDVATPESLSLLVQLTDQHYDTPLYIFILQAIGRIGDNRWDGKYHEELSGVLEKEWSKPEVTDPNYIVVLAKAIASIGSPSGTKTLVNTLSEKTKNYSSNQQISQAVSEPGRLNSPNELNNALPLQDLIIVNSIPPNGDAPKGHTATVIGNSAETNVMGQTNANFKPPKNQVLIDESQAATEIALETTDEIDVMVNGNSEVDIDTEREKQSQSYENLSSISNPNAVGELMGCFLNNPVAKPACADALALINTTHKLPERN